MKISFLKKIRYFFELIAVKIGILLFKILGLKQASNFGSFLAKLIGKRISVQKLAKKNISNSFKDLKDEEIEDILDEMWDNLGRISGEFAHCCSFSKDEISNYFYSDDETIKNIKHIKENYNGGIIFSGHIGNWEVGPKFFLHHGINVKTLYRPLNNEAVDQITSQVRNIDLIAKNAKGNKQIISEIKKGNYIIILVDQKVSDGIWVPFLGRDALTSSSVARLSIKYDIPLIPARSIRVEKGFKFKIEVQEAIKCENKDLSLEERIFNLTKKVNEKLESWIKEYPGQWFWVHNRWKK